MKQGFLLVCSLSLLLAACSPSPQSVLAKANEFYSQGKYGDAEIQYRKLLNEQNLRSEVSYRLGLTSLKLNKLDQAYESFQRTVALDPKHREAHSELAALLLASYWNDSRKPQPIYDQLRQLSTHLLVLDPKSYQGHRVEGYLAISDNRPEAAQQSFRQALAAKPFDPDVTALLVQAHIAAGNPAEGERIARQFLSSRPQGTLLYDVLYREYARTQRLAEAEALRLDQSRANSQDLAAWLALARHYRRFGPPAKAAQVLSPLLDNPQFPGAPLAIGDFYQQSAEFEPALEHYRIGERKDPANPVYLKRQYTTLLQQDRTAEARQVIERAVRTHQKDPDFPLFRAILNLDTATPATLSAVVEEFRAFLKTHPGSNEARYHLGRALLRQRNWNAAREILREAIRLNPEYLEPRFALISLAMARRAFDQALREADAILTLSPTNEMAQLNRMAALRSMGRFAEAREILTTLRKNNPRSPSLDLEMAFLYLVEGKPEPAEKLLRPLYRPGQPNIRVVAGLAESLTAQKRYDETLALLEQDLAQTPDRELVVFARAETLLRKGDTNKAAAALEQLTKAHPDSPDAPRRLAEIHLLQGHPGQAIAVLQPARARFPADPTIVALLAQAYETTGDATAAEKQYRDWMAIETNNPVPSNNLAYLLADTGKSLDEAVRLAQAAVRSAPGEPGFAHTLGFAYLQRGQTEAAIRVLAELSQKQPEQPIFRYHHALALIQQGDRAKAKLELEAALRGKPPAGLRDRITLSLKQL